MCLRLAITDNATIAVKEITTPAQRLCVCDRGGHGDAEARERITTPAQRLCVCDPDSVALPRLPLPHHYACAEAGAAMSAVVALFVQTNGAYFGLPDVDPWDEQRDARLYAGPHPVVAHPPCSRWINLGAMNFARYGGEHNRPGNDGGCFASALAAVRRWGGVLEHPACSGAWPAFELPRPVRAWTMALCGGWVTEVSQGAYGHRARKGTWLYYCGHAPPPILDWSDPPPSAQVSYLRNHRPTGLPPLTRRESSATPPAFRDLLLLIARSARLA